jgi:hypothetical protein
MLSPITEQASFACHGSLTSTAGVSSEQFLSLLKTDHTHQSVESAVNGEEDTKAQLPEVEIVVEEPESEGESEGSEVGFDNPCNPFLQPVISSILDSARERFGTPSNLHFEGKLQIFKFLENAVKSVAKTKSIRESIRELNVQVSLSTGSFTLLEKVGQGGFARYCLFY